MDNTHLPLFSIDEVDFIIAFLSRVKSVCMSVRPSVCLSVTFRYHENGFIYRHSFFHHTVAQSF